MALMLTYRMVAKKVIPYPGVKYFGGEMRIDGPDVVKTAKDLFDEMNSDKQMNFGRLLAYIRYLYFHYDLTEKEEEELVDFLRIRCPNYFPSNSLVWLVSWLIEYALSLMNYDNLLFHL